MRGYSFGSTDAFSEYNCSSNEPLSANYVDGVSITYSTPSIHIWTYAAEVKENAGHYVLGHFCPCTRVSALMSPPLWVVTTTVSLPALL